MPALNQKDAEHYIVNRKQFTASALRGSSCKGWVPEAGRLNAEEYAKLDQTVRYGSEWVYVVWSYDTPIAWFDEEGWYVVAQKFSVTTSKHQNLIRRAIADSLQEVN
jgi:hypothetical protein